MKSGRYSLSMILAISVSCFLAAAQQSATTQSSAPVPRLVNFTGKAADAQGKPIAGIAGVTLAIYKDQYEGAPLWLETQNIQADAKGNYTVQLGATKPAGLPPNWGQPMEPSPAVPTAFEEQVRKLGLNEQ